MDDEAAEISPHWHLASSLSVIEAALLIVGIEPQGTSAFVENWRDDRKPAGYLAARRAIVSAIVNGLVEGRIACGETDIGGDGEHPREGTNYAVSEVDVASLRNWLESKGVKHGFFSAGGAALAKYLDPKNPRYAPKLAAGVDAWLQGDPTPTEKGTVKQVLAKRLRKKAAHYGLVDGNGRPAESVIEDVAKLVNWQPIGGAPKKSKPVSDNWEEVLAEDIFA